MTDRGSCSRAELDGRRIVVDLSDADLAQLTATAARRGVDGSMLVLGWIRGGLLSNSAWDGPGDRADRIARDVAVARRSEDLFRDLLSDPDPAD
ncbi:hypothetical protein AB1046_22835 [Promicromonospora sp. Populi]|uniref:hypothetical protein n=1 Tax=Promicromonospora sp. Populi TaxID=3239420 RepID=UPI0034E2005A